MFGMQINIFIQLLCPVGYSVRLAKMA
jgi:hypothetical protein